MVAKAQHHEERLPIPPAKDTVASAEVSLYRNVLKIKKEHGLQDLGISFFDAETTIQWSYNADEYFHAASTMKLAVLLGSTASAVIAMSYGAAVLPRAQKEAGVAETEADAEASTEA